MSAKIVEIADPTTLQIGEAVTFTYTARDGSRHEIAGKFRRYARIDGQPRGTKSLIRLINDERVFAVDRVQSLKAKRYDTVIPRCEVCGGDLTRSRTSAYDHPNVHFDCL